MFTHIEEMVSTYAVKVILDPQGKRNTTIHENNFETT